MLVHCSAYRRGIAVAWLILCNSGVAVGQNDRTPATQSLLFRPLSDRDLLFRQMEKENAHVVIRAGGAKVHTFSQGAPVRLPLDLEEYSRTQRVAGLIIVHRNRIRLERYALGFDARSRWTSFSVAKSFTSTLAGAAVRDGHIKSLEDKVTAYLPDLKGSAYEGVTVRQLLTMTSGVKWNEDYTDPNSDVARFLRTRPDPGMNVTVSYLRRLPRAHPPGSQWLYSTAETNLIGILVSKAIGRKLSDYLSEKIWKPFGMEQDAVWLLDPTGDEISGCCISATLRDYARFGQFILEGGRIRGRSILPDDWLAAATVKQVDIGQPGRGYGYQWWTNDDGSFQGVGIFGQSLFIDPKRKLVIATNGSWPTATDRKGLQPARAAFFRTVQSAIDAEGSR